MLPSVIGGPVGVVKCSGRDPSDTSEWAIMTLRRDWRKPRPANPNNIIA
jgi:hypothetical protein